MARLSQSLIGAMAQPGYSGMLGDAVSGAFGGVVDASNTRRKNLANESVQAMLTGGDVNDPNVQQSVQAVYSQMGLDPLDAQSQIKAAQIESRAQEQEARAQKNSILQQEQALRQKATHELAMKRAGEVDAKTEARTRTLKLLNAGKDADTILKTIPPEHHDEAMATISGEQKFRENMQGFKDRASVREPYDEDTLKEMAKIPGSENAIAAYKKMFKNNPAAANRFLLNQLGVAHTASLRDERQYKAPSATSVEHYSEWLDTLDLDRIGTSSGSFSLGIGDGIPSGMKPAISLELARREMLDRDFVPTEATVLDVIDGIRKKNKAANGKVDPQANEDAMKAEMQQLRAMWQKDPTSMTDEQKQRASELVTYFKSKEK